MTQDKVIGVALDRNAPCRCPACDWHGRVGQTVVLVQVVLEARCPRCRLAVHYEGRPGHEPSLPSP